METILVYFMLKYCIKESFSIYDKLYANLLLFCFTLYCIYLVYSYNHGFLYVVIYFLMISLSFLCNA